MIPGFENNELWGAVFVIVLVNALMWIPTLAYLSHLSSRLDALEARLKELREELRETLRLWR